MAPRKYVTDPLSHEQAAHRARQYADRARRSQTGWSGKGLDPVPWITLYLRRYRYLTGRYRAAGPLPTWAPMPRHTVGPRT
jgi:hypothetical protein